MGRAHEEMGLVWVGEKEKKMGQVTLYVTILSVT